MTPELEHPRDAIQQLLDDTLDSGRRAEVEAHLATCASCRRELEALQWMKRLLAERLSAEEMPAELPRKLARALDREDRNRASWKAWLFASGWRWRLAMAAVALALVMVLVVVFGILRGRSTSPVLQVAADYRTYARGQLPLELRTGTPKELETYFAARNVGFPTRVFDFAMMNYALVGGRVHDVAGQSSALFAYQSRNGAIVLCQMYEGSVLDALAVHRDSQLHRHNEIDFHVFRDGDVTLVFWQEGRVVCVLASSGSPEEAVQLAFAKAVKL